VKGNFKVNVQHVLKFASPILHLLPRETLHLWTTTSSK